MYIELTKGKENDVMKSFLFILGSLILFFVTNYLMERELKTKNVETGTTPWSPFGNIMVLGIYLKHKKNNKESLGLKFWINILAILCFLATFIAMFLGFL